MSASKIKGYRAMLGMTQEQMAKELELSLRSYATKEKGQIAFKADELVRLKQVFKDNGLDVNIDDLINA